MEEEQIFTSNQPSLERPLSPAIQDLLKSYQKFSSVEEEKAPEPTVRVNEVLGSIAFIYERIRNAIDYKGDHLLRRNAIERILKRRLWEKPQITPKDLALSLIRELTWARYIKNDSIPKTDADKIGVVLAKYMATFNLVMEKSRNGDKKEVSWKDWVFGIASTEVEEIITPSLFFVNTYAQTMYSWFKTHFEWESDELSQKTRDIQLYIAIHRSLPKSDEPMIRYYLLNLRYPNWKQADNDLIKEVSEKLPHIRAEIEKELNHPVRFSIFRFIQRHTAPFQVLKDIIDEDTKNAPALLSDRERLEEKIREVCSQRYTEIREKVSRGIVRSIIYIFATKIIFAFLFEIPYEMFFLKKINPIPLSINAIVPPFLMFLVGLTIRTPGEDNTLRLIERIKGIVYARKEFRKVSFSLARSNRSQLLTKVFSLFYFIIFLITFGLIASLLYRLHFNIVSGIIFFAFLSLILLFAFRVRFSASELNVTPEKENLFDHLLNNLSLPFLNIGVVLSSGLSRLNFLMILMDFLIEAPLKSIIEVVEEWTSFLREKKEEVVEVPMQ